MRRSKSAYYQTKIKEVSQAKDVKKTWKLINNLIGKGGKSINIVEININDNVYSDPKHMAEHLNDYFVNVGPTLASQSKCSSEFDEDTEFKSI